MQTAPLLKFPTTLRKAYPRILEEEGIHGFYKSLVPLWCRQIPYTMIKFACFERTVEELYHEAEWFTCGPSLIFFSRQLSWL